MTLQDKFNKELLRVEKYKEQSKEVFTELYILLADITFENCSVKIKTEEDITSLHITLNFSEDRALEIIKWIMPIEIEYKDYIQHFFFIENTLISASIVKQVSFLQQFKNYINDNN